MHTGMSLPYSSLWSLHGTYFASTLGGNCVYFLQVPLRVYTKSSVTEHIHYVCTGGYRSHTKTLRQEEKSLRYIARS